MAVRCDGEVNPCRTEAQVIAVPQRGTVETASSTFGDREEQDGFVETYLLSVDTKVARGQAVTQRCV